MSNSKSAVYRRDCSPASFRNESWNRARAACGVGREAGGRSATWPNRGVASPTSHISPRASMRCGVMNRSVGRVSRRSANSQNRVGFTRREAGAAGSDGKGPALADLTGRHHKQSGATGRTTFPARRAFSAEEPAHPPTRPPSRHPPTRPRVPQDCGSKGTRHRRRDGRADLSCLEPVGDGTRDRAVRWATAVNGTSTHWTGRNWFGPGWVECPVPARGRD